MTKRNGNIPLAKDLIIENIDKYIGGLSIKPPPKSLRDLIDSQFSNPSTSVALASFFLLAYSIVDKSWGYSRPPIGWRGKFGDKGLSEELKKRFIPLGAVTAFGENLGTKGNVEGFDLEKDPRFKKFILGIRNLTLKEKESALDYYCYLACCERKEPQALPKLPKDYLTFSRSKVLFLDLLNLHSEGRIQQFIVASLLSVHRKRYGIEVVTHHPHASDTYDKSAGDIEEYDENRLVNAIEVTVRDDWRNRMSNFIDKLHRFSLKKYTIIAGNVNNDKVFGNARSLLDFLNKYDGDIAVIDIDDFISVFLAELRANEIQDAINLCYNYLCNVKLNGKIEYCEAYKLVVDKWLDK